MVKWGNAPANGARDCFCPWLEISRPAADIEGSPGKDGMTCGQSGKWLTCDDSTEHTRETC